MFDNFISLGWYCGTANSMSKLGIRSYSGPFDWYFSSLPSVMECMDNNFSDFLAYENLSVHADRGETFEDQKYGFVFPHDITLDLASDFDEIHKKYLRRIERFQSDIQNKTCFIRTVRDQKELVYIKENKEYIHRVLRRTNAENEIVFLVPRFLYLEESPCDYMLDISEFRLGNLEILRSIFDSSQEFREFCIENYDPDKRKDNLIFDAGSYTAKLRRRAYIYRMRYELMYKLAETDFSAMPVPDKIVIYGAGKIGRFFYDKIKDRCEVKYFIDKVTTNDSYDATPIFNLHCEDKINEYDAVIIITPIYDIDRIKKALGVSQFHSMSAISLGELLF